jgi:hypothetical protein
MAIRTSETAGRLDAVETAYFTNQTAQIRNRLYEVRYPELRARNFIPVDNETNTGATHVFWRSYDAAGTWRLISDYAHDFPRSDLFTKEFSASIRGLGSSYGYNIQEIRTATLAGVDLEQRKANRARRSIEEGIEHLAKYGSPQDGFYGLVNQPNALQYTVPVGAADGATSSFEDKSGDEIVADLNAMVGLIRTTTKGLEAPDTLLLPPNAFTVVSTRRMDTSTETTILKFFLANNQYIRNVDEWDALAGAGDGSLDRAIVYRRSADHLQLVIPQEFEQFEPDKKGMEYVTPCHARCGGVILWVPFSMCYADGV